MQVWDSETLECLRTLEGHEDNVRVLAVGERYVFSGSWDKSIRCAPALACTSNACLAAARDCKPSLLDRNVSMCSALCPAPCFSCTGRILLLWILFRPSRLWFGA